MNSKQKYMYTFMFLVGLTALVSSFIYSPAAYAAISKDRFAAIMCDNLHGPPAPGIKNPEKACKEKVKKDGRIKLGNKTYKFADWKNESAADLKEAKSVGATTPKKLKEHREEKDKNPPEDGDNPTPKGAGCSTSLLPGSLCSSDGTVEGNGVFKMLIIAIRIMVSGIAIVAVGGIIYGSVLYSTAGDNSQQVEKAIKTILNVVLGIVLFAGMWAISEWLIPGGIFKQ